MSTLSKGISVRSFPYLSCSLDRNIYALNPILSTWEGSATALGAVVGCCVGKLVGATVGEPLVTVGEKVGAAVGEAVVGCTAANTLE